MELKLPTENVDNPVSPQYTFHNLLYPHDIHRLWQDTLSSLYVQNFYPSARYSTTKSIMLRISCFERKNTILSCSSNSTHVIICHLICQKKNSHGRKQFDFLGFYLCAQANNAASEVKPGCVNAGWLPQVLSLDEQNRSSYSQCQMSKRLFMKKQLYAPPNVLLSSLLTILIMPKKFKKRNSNLMFRRQLSIYIYIE